MYKNMKAENSISQYGDLRVFAISNNSLTDLMRHNLLFPNYAGSFYVQRILLDCEYIFSKAFNHFPVSHGICGHLSRLLMFLCSIRILQAIWTRKGAV